MSATEVLLQKAPQMARTVSSVEEALSTDPSCGTGGLRIGRRTPVVQNDGRTDLLRLGWFVVAGHLTLQ